MRRRKPSPILDALANHFEKLTAGRVGGAERDVQPLFDDLVIDAGCREGDAYERAMQDIADAVNAGVITVEYDNRKARTRIHKVRLSPANEDAFYQFLGRESPSRCRARWATLFRDAGVELKPTRFQAEWAAFCATRAENAPSWKDMLPFRRDDIKGGEELLKIVCRLLSWEGEALVRWVSSAVCEDSKRLERQQNLLERLLSDATDGQVTAFQQLGIMPIPTDVTFHGPLRLKLDGEWTDYDGRQEYSTLSVTMIERAEHVECGTRRCLTIENKTPFVDIAKFQSGELLIWTSYPSEATLTLLRRVGGTVSEFWHFGDTDPAGFDVLRDLRERSGLRFRPLHMRYRARPKSRALTPIERTRLERLIEMMVDEREHLEALLKSNSVGDFEQESLGRPPLRHWPFYPA